MSDPAVAIVVSPRDWAERLHRFVADHGGARVRTRVLAARDALEDDYSVLVVEDLTSFLTPRLVHEVQRRGRRILGVFDPDEPTGRDRLVDLGVDDVLPAGSAPEEFVRAIELLALPLDLDRELDALTGLGADDEGWGADDDVERGQAGGSGHVLVVAGPPGGPGVTEIAIGLAARLRAKGTCVLVDADPVAPCLAQRLGLPLHPNVLTAIDAIEHRGSDLERALLSTPDRSLEVLPGLANPRDWAALRPDSLATLLEELRRRRAAVVVDAGHATEDVTGYGGALRFGASRASLQLADELIAVCAPTPVGIARFVDWAADLRSLAPDRPVHLVVNRTPRSRFQRAEVRDELARSVDVTSFHEVPEDRRVLRAAWDGSVVRSGPGARALAGLVAALRRGVVRTAGGAAA